MGKIEEADPDARTHYVMIVMPPSSNTIDDLESGSF